MDREADFLDLFIERRANAPQVDLLVRAKVDRVLGKEQTPDGHTVSRHLFDQVRKTPARGGCTVEMQRLSARVKASKQARKDRRAARGAEVTLRYQQVALPCPGAAAVELWVVHAREEQPPQVRLQGRGVAAPHGRAARTRHGPQDGHRVADPVDGPARARGA